MNEEPAPWPRTLEFLDDPADCIDGSAAYGSTVIWPRQAAPLVGGMAVIALIPGLALVTFARVPGADGPVELFALGAWTSFMISLLTLWVATASYKFARRKAHAERAEPPKSRVRFEFRDEGYRVTSELGTASLSWLAVTDIVQKPTGVYLFLGSSCQCLPSRAFRDEVDRAVFAAEAIKRLSEPARARSLKTMTGSASSPGRGP